MYNARASRVRRATNETTNEVMSMKEVTIKLADVEVLIVCEALRARLAAAEQGPRSLDMENYKTIIRGILAKLVKM